MKRLLMTTFAAALIFLLSRGAYAQTIQYDTTIDQLGVSGSLAHFSIVGSLSITCPYGLVYVDLTSMGGRSSYALLLAAKLTGNPLAEIRYLLQTKEQVEPQSLCYLYLVSIQD